MNFSECQRCGLNTFLYEDDMCAECVNAVEEEMIEIKEKYDAVSEELSDDELRNIMKNSFTVMQTLYSSYLEKCKKDGLNPFYGSHAEITKAMVKDVSFQAHIASILLSIRKNARSE